MDPVATAVILPFAGAVIVLFAGRWSTVVAVSAGVAAMLASLWLLGSVWQEGVRTLAVARWSPPLGIELRADGPAAALVAVTAIVALGATLYAGQAPGLGRSTPASAAQWIGPRAFWPLWLLLWGALNVSFLTRDLFNFYVSLELITLAAVALVALGQDRTALTAAMRYLLAAFLGSLLYLLGVALVYGSHGALDLGFLSASGVGPSPATWGALAFITVGLLLKSALFPLHFWLPRAHASAPPPVSAVLSALVVKVSFVMLLRIWLDVFPIEMTLPAAQLVAALGVAAIVSGSLQAIRSERLKTLIAHSTVAQMGMLAVILPLVVSGASAPGWSSSSVGALQGGFYHLITHALAKAAMFLAAGAVVAAYGTDRLSDLTGAAGARPLAFAALGLAGVALIGIPPSGGFVAKWQLVAAALDQGQWWWAAAFLASGLLTAGYVFHAIGHGMAQPADEVAQRQRQKAIPRALELTALGLAVASVALGLRAAEPLALLADMVPGS